MGIFTAPAKVVYSNNALPQRIGNKPLMGLGYRYFGENPSGVSGVTRFNRRSSQGRQGTGPWSLVPGSIFSGPDDPKLAEWVYRFQHDYQNCPGYEAGQNLNNVSKTWNVRQNIAYCKNRDGMIGNGTMCQIVKAIATNVPFWGKFWSDNINPQANTNHYLRADLPECGFLCSDVACNKRNVTGCPPCGDTSANVVVTPVIGGGGTQFVYIPPPGKEEGGRPAPPPPPPAPAPSSETETVIGRQIEEEDNTLLILGVVGVLGIGGYLVAKKLGYIK